VFEDRTGMTAGPTVVMRSEHAQMNELLDALSQAMAARDADAYLGYAETLLMLIRQHNIKEEQILYPMIDRIAVGDENELLARLDQLAKAPA
jgi:hemerythrin-like domain-containing protein